ncbi:S8 family serine peptidase [Halocatena marina]|uniref:S8 family serine peptidase n=1 Tax=Halocatena marina TaxID=2934937 RepID=UPI00221F54A9|nr:S8 family serine peptidase [Halocatena marina]
MVAVLIFSSLSLSFSSDSFMNADDSTNDDSSAEAIEALKRHIDRQPYEPPPSVNREVEIVVPVQNDTDIPRDSNGFNVERIYTDEGQRFVRGSIQMSDVRSLLQDQRMKRVRITSNYSVSDDRVASGVNQINADTLQKRGITGENVTVGIIDSDFWISHPSIARQVSAYYSFGPASDWQHGTAVASGVTDTAPDANLHLASVGPTTTPEEYASAVEWLEQSGADVIVDAGSYYTQPGDGTGEIAHVATNVSSETVFVTSVGNHAQRYWAGNHSSDEWIAFHNGSQANPLNNGDPLSGKVQLTLRWGSWSNASAEYDLYLFRVQPGEDAVVARTTGNEEEPIEHLTTTVQRGQYYVSIRSETDPNEINTNTNATATSDHPTIELFSNHDLRYQSIGGKAPPANAPNVLAVGASDDGAVESFSARGPDIVAPDSVLVEGATVEGGTSFSTPYVAGTAALLLSENPDMTAEKVRMLLLLSADDIGVKGTDSRSGFGRVNASRAAELMNKTSGGQFTSPSLDELHGPQVGRSPVVASRRALPGDL